MNKIDRIANAARKEIFGVEPHTADWEALNESAKQVYRKAVIGTLKAIREPTEEQIKAGRLEMPVEYKFWNEGGMVHSKMLPANESVSPAGPFKAMIDTLLK